MILPARVASLPDGIAEGARSDAASVARLLRQLVRAPSRGGIDPYGPVVGVVEGWLGRRGLLPRVLHRGTDPVAVVCDVTGAAGPGRHYVLDACLDTASFGDEAAWRHPPTSGAVEDGWLYGRGCSDSKAAVAIFCHVTARLADARDRFGGTVTLLFDLDEHTGGFSGIGRYLDEQDATPIDGVLIGYPGPDTVVIGGRGFLRMRISVFGIADHSASKNPRPQNAIVRASHLIGRLRALELPQPVPGDDFDVPPKLTVTSIKGGAPDSYSVVPDRCEIHLDVRLTPRFDDGAAWSLLTSAVADFDRRAAGVRPSIAERTTQSWPPYRLPDGHELPTRLIASAAEAGLHPIPVVAGPSNIGNLLAARGIPATVGFGVRYRNLHGTDEAIELGSIPGVQATYHRAVLDLLHPARKGRSRTQPDATNRAAGVLPMLFHH